MTIADRSALGVRGPVFPLPLTVFEEYLLLDGPHAMDMWVEVGLSDPPSRPALQQAVAALASRHPLLTARVEASDRGLEWVATSREVPVSFLRDDDAFLPARLDPRSGAGARVYSQGRLLHVHVHHACSDGTGLRAIVHDLLLAYARASAPLHPWPELPRLEQQRLRDRGRLDTERPRPDTRQFALDVLRFLFPLPRAIAPASDHDVSDGIPFSVHVCEPNEAEAFQTAALRSAAGRAREHVISSTFATIAAWQRERRRSTGRLRLLIPWDMRDWDDRRLPACNRLSYAFLDRAVDQCGGDRTASVAADLEWIRRERPHVDFLRALHAVRDVGILGRVLRLPVSLSTAVLTDMGNVMTFRGIEFTPEGAVMGDTIARYAVGVAPVRTGTSLAIGIGRAGSRVALAVRADRARIGVAAERWVLQDLTRRLTDGGDRGQR